MGARTCNDPAHETARRAVEAERLADRTYGTPCLVCGAPILNGKGHDAGCMVARDAIERLTRHPVHRVWMAAQDLGNALGLWDDQPCPYGMPCHPHDDLEKCESQPWVLR